MERLLISACLLGVRCRYDGRSVAMHGLDALMERYALIPVCPEILGGLPTPRTPCERIGDRVLTQDGMDVTECYMRGASEVARLAELYRCRRALLKERSPSCGCGRIYDGTFSGTLTDGEGVCAALLRQNGITVLGETRVDELLDEAERL